MTAAKLSENQITLSNAIALIDSDDVLAFDIHYTECCDDGQKNSIYYSDCLDDDEDLTVEEFIEQADNYGSFWLRISDKNTSKTFQIVSDKTFEPL